MELAIAAVFMETMMNELDDFREGMTCLTPTGRRVIVKRILSGASRRDAFQRVICQYEGRGPKDLVTLQPHQLRIVEDGKPTAIDYLKASIDLK